MHQAQELLARVDNESAKVGLQLNVLKTEVMVYNLEQPINIKTRCGKTLKVVKNLSDSTSRGPVLDYFQAVFVYFSICWFPRV